MLFGTRPIWMRGYPNWQGSAAVAKFPRFRKIQRRTTKPTYSNAKFENKSIVKVSSLVLTKATDNQYACGISVGFGFPEQP